MLEIFERYGRMRRLNHDLQVYLAVPDSNGSYTHNLGLGCRDELNVTTSTLTCVGKHRAMTCI